MIFFGTGAAELYPDPFCNCPNCSAARARGEMPRKRSALYVDAHTMIDFGPEVLAASCQYQAPLYDLDQLFITHTHEDHLCFDNINVLTMTAWRKGRTLKIFLSEKALAWVRAKMDALKDINCQAQGTKRLEEEGYIQFIPVKPGTSFDTGDWHVTAQESIHHAYGDGELALNYLLKADDGRSLLYVSDSGLYSEKQLSAFENAQAKNLVMEGTWGNIEIGEDNGHLNMPHYVENLRRMLSRKVIAADCEAFVTHINPKGSQSTVEYQAYMDANAPIHVTVAHDGQEVAL